MTTRRYIHITLVALTVTALGSPRAAAQDDGFTWENSTELSFISTGGNASASSFGLKASMTGTGGPNEFKLEAGGIRSESDLKVRTATGTASDFDVTEVSVHSVTAENYFLRGRYDRELEHAFAFSGAGWERNTFAGVKNRFSFVAGIGRTLFNWEDEGHLKADVGGTYTIQKDVDPEPDADESFGGIRVTVDAKRAVTPSTDYESALVVDENLEDTDDLRADWINSITVGLNERLAFKTSLQLLYDHKPSNIGVPLFDAGGNPTGQNVLTPGEELDHIVTLTLVIKL
jgi:putative salt-induced outer membrane protein YdiY